MKLLDADETIILVTGSGEAAIERDRPLALWLQAEIDRRGDGQAYRRAVVTDDVWYLESGVLHQHPTIAIGGPGVNEVTQQFAPSLPTIFNDDERVYVQADFEGEVKRAGLWGADAAATSAAVDAFVVHGYLDDLLKRIWRFRTEMMV